MVTNTTLNPMEHKTKNSAMQRMHDALNVAGIVVCLAGSFTCFFIAFT